MFSSRDRNFRPGLGIRWKNPDPGSPDLQLGKNPDPGSRIPDPILRKCTPKFCLLHEQVSMQQVSKFEKKTVYSSCILKIRIILRNIMSINNVISKIIFIIIHMSQIFLVRLSKDFNYRNVSIFKTCFCILCSFMYVKNKG